jgi:hypothetical protein
VFTKLPVHTSGGWGIAAFGLFFGMFALKLDVPVCHLFALVLAFAGLFIEFGRAYEIRKKPVNLEHLRMLSFGEQGLTLSAIVGEVERWTWQEAADNDSSQSEFVITSIGGTKYKLLRARWARSSRLGEVMNYISEVQYGLTSLPGTNLPPTNSFLWVYPVKRLRGDSVGCIVVPAVLLVAVSSFSGNPAGYVLGLPILMYSICVLIARMHDLNAIFREPSVLRKMYADEIGLSVTGFDLKSERWRWDEISELTVCGDEVRFSGKGEKLRFLSVPGARESDAELLSFLDTYAELKDC